MSTEGISRRHVIAGAAAAGVGVPLLAACGGSAGGGTTKQPPASAGEDLGPTTAVPVGGGKIFPDQQVVVTQPTRGTFKCFGAVCTHQHCLVSSVEGGTINCACHGSKFSIQDGSVVTGPASSPLPAVGVEVAGGEITTT